MFGRYQLLGIVRVSTPAVLGSYGAATRKPFAVAVTSTLAVFLRPGLDDAPVAGRRARRPRINAAKPAAVLARTANLRFKT
jgi:hypothetical protein